MFMPARPSRSFLFSARRHMSELAPEAFGKTAQDREFEAVIAGADDLYGDVTHHGHRRTAFRENGGIEIDGGAF